MIHGVYRAGTIAFRLGIHKIEPHETDVQYARRIVRKPEFLHCGMCLETISQEFVCYWLLYRRR